MLGLVFIVFLILVAIFAPLVAPYDPIHYRAVGHYREGPSSEHWFGTDRIGRDVFSRVVYGARISLRIGFIATAMSLIIGVFLGAIAGFFGGVSDTLIMRFIDIFLAIPYIVLAVAIATILGRSENTVILVLGLTGWLGITRIVRASFLSLQRARVRRGGARARAVAHAHHLAAHPARTRSSRSSCTARSRSASVILAEAALSFLGVGPQDPTPGVGTDGVRGQGRPRERAAPALLPGPGHLPHRARVRLRRRRLRDALDPKLKGRK